MFLEKKRKRKIPKKVMVIKTEQYRRNLICYLNICLLQDYLLRGDAVEARMIWLSDLELTMN